MKVCDVPLDNASKATAFSLNGTETAHRRLPLLREEYRKASGLVTLDIIYQTLCPDITSERLSGTPDDQVLFFWCESAHLYLVKLDEDWIELQDTKGVQMRMRWMRTSGVPNWDELGGKWEAFEDPNGHERKERMKAEFIAIAEYRERFLDRKRNVVLMLIKREQGIAYRVAVLDDVPAQKWLECKPERILVALG